MKRRVLISLLMVCLLLLTAPVACNTSEPAEVTTTPPEVEQDFPEVPRITPQELNQLMDEGVDLVVVDVRDSSQYELGHVYRAVNIPYLPYGDPMERELTLISLPTNKLLVLYCGCESGLTSAIVALELWDLGYSKDLVKVMKGGFPAWDELSYPTATGMWLTPDS